MTRIVQLDVSGEAGPWERLGFTASSPDLLRIGDVALAFTGETQERGILAWTLTGEVPQDIDGLTTRRVTEAAAQTPRGPEHPNGTTHLDHVVVMTPDLDRTLTALSATGMDLRRVRDAGTPEHPLRQGFYRLGEVILEVVGNVPQDDGSARFWGLVAVVPDVDALATDLGPQLVGAPKEAVQPGRRIVTVRREAGLPVPLAFLTPHVRS
ncbi:VOC family protein [Paraconexibacter sp.]|uniref:VOC family protein n=1 Tax=Paraconexibacter sp. TaxID=2949640 RepID=UPI003567B54E